MTETATPATVRDFLYLDANRLHSLYSQLFKGLPEQIIHSYGGERTSKEGTEDAVGAGRRVDVEVAEATLKTENRVLLDYMYSRLDERLAANITTVTAENKGQLSLAAGQLLRVVGRAKFLDYARLIGFSEQFGRFGEVIALAHITTLSKQVETLRAQAEQVADRETRKEAQALLKAIKNPAEMAKRLGLAPDEKVLEGIRFTVNMMYPGGFDALIAPGDDEASLAFRGILDRRWLRIDTNRLNAAYGASTEFDVVMVGQICRTETQPPNNPAPSESATLSDHLQHLFGAIAEIQQKFDETAPGKRVITVLPLALYTELALK